MSQIPQHPKIYHIVHKNRFQSIIQDGYIFSDAIIRTRNNNLPIIGLADIKARRLNNHLNCYPDLTVGQCVPFYFCPRSIMLYMINQRNPNLQYQNGQDDIIHLQADLYQVIEWANLQNIRWAFTTSNAGSCYFNDYNEINELGEIDWVAVHATQWQNHKEGKQAEFLIESKFPIHLIEKIGVYSQSVYDDIANIMQTSNYQVNLEICRDWYY